jgi:hypothetical protein
MAQETYSGLALADDGTVTGALAHYLRTTAEPNLFNGYEFVALATEAEVPNGAGVWMSIPHYANSGTNGALGQTWADKANGLSPVGITGEELNPLVGLQPDLAVLRQSRTDTIDRKMSYFTDGFGISKVNKTTRAVQGEFERISQFIMKTAAATQETLLQANIIYEFNSGGASNAITDPTNTGVIWASFGATEGYNAGDPMYVSPDVEGSAWGSIVAGDYPVANKFAYARKLLKQYGNPGFSQLGNKLCALIGPDTNYRLSTSVTSASNAAALTFEQESMGMSQVFKDAVVGDLFGFRLIETNNPIVIPGDTTNGPSTDGGGSTDVDCEINVLFAPDAFYVTPHEGLTPQLYVSGFNEGGAFNPTKTVSSLATDFMFGALRGPAFDKKMILMPCPIA